MWPFSDDSSSKRISSGEFAKVRSRLLGHGFTPTEVERVEGFFQGSLGETGSQKGVDPKEAARTLEWIEKNPSAHKLSDRKLQILKESLEKHM